MNETEQTIALIVLALVLFFSIFSSKKKSQALSLVIEESQELENQINSFKTGNNKLKKDLENEKETVNVLKLLVRLNPEKIVSKIKKLTAELKKYKASYFVLLEEFEKLQDKKGTDKDYLNKLEEELKTLKKYVREKIKDKEVFKNGIPNRSI